MPLLNCLRFVPALFAAFLPAAEPALAKLGSTGAPLVVIRDAETETLLRTFATPLFRAAGLDPNLVRIIVIRDDAINSFVSTGNRMLIPTGLIGVMADAPGDRYGWRRPVIGSIRLRAQDISNAVKKETRFGDEP